MSEITPRQILDLPMPENDSGASTVRGYLVALLLKLWRDGEMFSGKRPFGTSSWEFDLYQVLGRAGVVQATFDEDGYLDVFPQESQARADALIAGAITALGAAQ